MRLVDVYNRIDETLDKPLPHRALSRTINEIDLGEQKLLVQLYPERVDKYNCLAVSFGKQKSATPTAMTNFFNGPGAIRVFSTIVSIIDPIPFDLIFFTPDDIDVKVENKKLKLYQVVLKKLERQGKIAASEVLNIPEYHQPILVGMRVGVDKNTLEYVVKMFGLSKMERFAQ